MKELGEGCKVKKEGSKLFHHKVEGDKVIDGSIICITMDNENTFGNIDVVENEEGIERDSI